MEYTKDRLNAEIRRLEQELKNLKQSDAERLLTEIVLVLIGIFAGFWAGYLLGTYR